ncbi:MULTISPECIES: DNA-binding protein [unclassified Serratia (in: enterobacteria)]|nr:DNA-binding protein [Serratia sp. C2(2)]MEE4449324.1 DNA-binding protein [Serratia sp. C2(1)]
MTLDNLVGIGLEAIPPDSGAIRKLLSAAARNRRDASITQLSNESRFDTAYKAVMQMANAALQAQGFRTLTSKPGHHQIVIQSLPLTVGIPRETMICLDTLRKQRNIADYSGDLVTDAAVQACLEQAEALWLAVNDWLRLKHPQLLESCPSHQPAERP